MKRFCGLTPCGSADAGPHGRAVAPREYSATRLRLRYLVFTCFLLGLPIVSAGVSVQPTPIAYLGSFAAPAGFDYDGKALTLNETGDGLFFAAGDRIAEISIVSGGTASFRQQLRQFGGNLSDLGVDGGGGYRIGGMLVYGGQLHISGFIYYDTAHAQTRSHWTRSTTLSSGAASGPIRIGPMGGGFYSGYMAVVPEEHRAALGGPVVAGNCCLSIIGRTSYGPALFAYDPASPGKAAPLVYYDSAHQALGNYSDRRKPNPVFNGTTKITGVVIPRGGDSVYFFGSTGEGTACYGTGAQCNDPSNPYSGDHAYPYRVYVWAYRVSDLAAVRAGKRRPWQIAPYYVGRVPGTGDVTYDFGTGGAAIDHRTNRVYVAERNGVDGTHPRIHILQVGPAPSSSEPAADVPPDRVSVLP
jgi:hypothetical protein